MEIMYWRDAREAIEAAESLAAGEALVAALKAEAATRKAAEREARIPLFADVEPRSAAEQDAIQEWLRLRMRVEEAYKAADAARQALAVRRARMEIAEYVRVRGPIEVVRVSRVHKGPWKTGWGVARYEVVLMDGSPVLRHVRHPYVVHDADRPAWEEARQTGRPIVMGRRGRMDGQVWGDLDLLAIAAWLHEHE